MNRNIGKILAVTGILVAITASDLLAAGRGKGNGAGGGKRDGSCVSQGGTSVRPADSRRRDGTFQSTGVTANGSTTRPGKGKGVQDGSNPGGAATAPQ